MIPSVNFHLWQPCNMRCKFCYATFHDVKRSILPKGHLPKEQAIDVVRQLAAHGFQKINFAGGEPTPLPLAARVDPRCQGGWHDDHDRHQRESPHG
ncbi:MAG: radical SAM protein [Flavobacteriales bacterium]|nr:radical SAM protein [Flavobacteriales bacterium]